MHEITRLRKARNVFVFIGIISVTGCTVGIVILRPTSGTMNLFNQDFGEGSSNLRSFLQNVYKKSPDAQHQGFFYLFGNSTIPKSRKSKAIIDSQNSISKVSCHLQFLVFLRHIQCDFSQRVPIPY